jgi:hypothetical protein
MGTPPGTSAGVGYFVPWGPTKRVQATDNQDEMIADNECTNSRQTYRVRVWRVKVADELNHWRTGELGVGFYRFSLVWNRMILRFWRSQQLIRSQRFPVVTTLIALARLYLALCTVAVLQPRDGTGTIIIGGSRSTKHDPEINNQDRLPAMKI